MSKSKDKGKDGKKRRQKGGRPKIPAVARRLEKKLAAQAAARSHPRAGGNATEQTENGN